MTTIALTPVTIIRKGWSAVSADGQFTYTRTEDSKTTWEIRAAGHESFALAPSLIAARRMTVDGSALRIIKRQEAEMAATLAAVTGGAR